ncbi:hypothetical protein fugu_010199 [Takifugu bimaculatus]|uniref:Uncharacterized protein n=1 Tax=Takifugu bimaculatus TaxID=433685 RepID=A0A4Z2CEP0_9TELE|nr:hypothetical protein fugu_010199 [Takifugu bimaculatus]
MTSAHDPKSSSQTQAIWSELYLDLWLSLQPNAASSVGRHFSTSVIDLRSDMNSVARVKKSLRAPIKKLANCVSGLKGRGPGAKRWNRRGRGGGGRGGCCRSRRTPPHRATRCREPPTVRSYQADVEKERQLREAANAQKNAQRAAMRAHFRRKYQLSENSKDTNRLRTVGGKPSLPRELSKIIHPEANPKDSSFNLLRAFQGLSVGTATRAERHRSRGSAPAGRGEAFHQSIQGREFWDGGGKESLVDGRTALEDEEHVGSSRRRCQSTERPGIPNSSGGGRGRKGRGLQRSRGSGEQEGRGLDR